MLRRLRRNHDRKGTLVALLALFALIVVIPVHHGHMTLMALEEAAPAAPRAEIAQHTTHYHHQHHHAVAPAPESAMAGDGQEQDEHAPMLRCPVCSLVKSASFALPANNGPIPDFLARALHPPALSASLPATPEARPSARPRAPPLHA